jgi:hypothetical protein
MSLLALVLVAGGAQPTTAAPPRVAPQANERRVCRTEERLGTILPRRRCRSVTEWAELDRTQNRHTERDTASMRNHTRTSLADGPNGPAGRGE